ncbi:extracellular solute-binding protein [Paenibacillus hexagrammi]|uniref:Extracellular solute-binding protein n=1 Tax=Paenibacillus hexagrammi TaxID=2908839 RepID=A0ABY3SLB6_9BACL|nr:extracellular solute-binding protein [Paenibacillus sp. YPD9-1]UJF34014.1 extracellular solute-binding protein [Paenibacillus sp. YPD9-1]
MLVNLSSRKKWASLLLINAMMLTTVACGSTEGASSKPAADATAEPSKAAASTPAASEKPNTEEPAQKTDEPLVVYLNDFDEIIKPMFEQATGYKLELVTGNGAEISSRLEAEKGNPHWDVVWMDAMPTIDKMGKDGQLLENWKPQNIGNLTDFAKQFVPSTNSYVPTGAHAASVIVYNTKAFNANTAPKTWKELASATFKGSIGMADPAVAAPAYPFVAWFFQAQGMDAGKQYFESLMKNGLHVYPKNPNVAKALTSGEIKAAALQESNAYIMKNQGQPVDIIWPEEGAPASVRVAAIQKNTKHAEAAKAFIEFLLDPKTQQTLIDKEKRATSSLP